MRRGLAVICNSVGKLNVVAVIGSKQTQLTTRPAAGGL